VIVVATKDFEVYHEVVTLLRDREIPVTTIEPDDSLPEETSVVIVGPEDELDVTPEVVTATPGEPRAAVDRASELLHGGGGRTVVGIDPGERPGIAVLSGETVVATFQVPVEQVATTVEAELEEASDPIVRVGDGARHQSARIVDDLEDVPVELVDETNTTPHLGTGTRGMGDVLAAVNIAQREGERISSREINPTEGEIRAIKARSRERSGSNRAIDTELARRVATGELSIDEALAEHAPDDD
jgi:hypothetical protein